MYIINIPSFVSQILYNKYLYMHSILPLKSLKKEVFDVNSYICTLTKILKIPCKHKIQTMLHNRGILTVEDFYFQYYFVNIVALIPSILPKNSFASSKDLHFVFNVIS